MSQSSKDTESKTLCSHFLGETQLGLELASTSYQSILHEQSHTIDLLSIQIDKYKNLVIVCWKFRNQQNNAKKWFGVVNSCQISPEVGLMLQILDLICLAHLACLKAIIMSSMDIYQLQTINGQHKIFVVVWGLVGYPVLLCGVCEVINKWLCNTFWVEVLQWVKRVRKYQLRLLTAQVG